MFARVTLASRRLGVEEGGHARQAQASASQPPPPQQQQAAQAPPPRLHLDGKFLSLALAAILGVAGGTWAVVYSIGKVELSLTKDMSVMRSDMHKDMSDMREQAARFEGFTAATLKHHGELLQELKSGQQELLKEVQQLKPTKG